MQAINTLISRFQPSVFYRLTQLAAQHQAINLAQGFPDFKEPEWVIELAKEALSDSSYQQYAHPLGLPILREAVSNLYHNYYQLGYDADSQVLITNGATEAIYAVVQALINPGDELVLFEPFYDSYLTCAQLAGAIPKVVTLQAPDFCFDIDELKQLLSKNTKLLILNTPHNPTGRVFSRSELIAIANLADEYDFYILADEVYEFLTFDHRHIPIATLAGIKERVLTVSSIGKSLSLTGWKVGWVCGSAALIHAIHMLHQYICFSVAHPLQAAIAMALPQLDNYLIDFKQSYLAKRGQLISGLREANFKVYTPQGTYFALAECPPGKGDFEFCETLIQERGVAAIPMSAFYTTSDEGKRLIRFCFAKREATIKAAINRLRGRENMNT